MSSPEPEPAPTPEPERPPVEIVEAPAAPSAEVEQAPGTDLERRNAVVEQITDAALAMPGVPGRDEFLALAMQARILSMSGAAPKAVRGNPYIAFHLAMVGRDLGISPSAALELIDVIGEGDKAQLSLSPQLLNGQIRRLGLGSIIPASRSDRRCVAVVLAPGGRPDPRCLPLLPEHAEDCACAGVLGTSEFTWEDAQMAGLARPECQPGEHTPVCMNGGQNTYGKRCQQGYRTYPKRMMWWRAAGYAADDYFPEAGLGLYTAEELGAVVDAEGRPIDPGDVELPDGYEPAAPPANPATDLLAEVDPDAHAGILARLEAVKAVPPAREALLAMWTAQDDAGVPALPLVARLQRRHAVKAKAMLASIEARIQKGEWEDEALAAWTRRTEQMAEAAAHAAGTTDPGPDEGEAGDAVRPATPPEGGNDGEGADPAGAPHGPEDGPEAAEEGHAPEDVGEADPTVMRRARAAQVARDAGLTPPAAWANDAELVEQVAAEVKAMSLGDVVQALHAAGLDAETGNPDTKRRRLAEHVYTTRGGK